jgi:hypothetical protein
LSLSLSEKSIQITSRPFSLLLRLFFAVNELSRLLTRFGDVFSSSSDERRSITSLMLVGRRHHRNAKRVWVSRVTLSLFIRWYS